MAPGRRSIAGYGRSSSPAAGVSPTPPLGPSRLCWSATTTRRKLIFAGKLGTGFPQQDRHPAGLRHAADRCAGPRRTAAHSRIRCTVPATVPRRGKRARDLGQLLVGTAAKSPGRARRCAATAHCAAGKLRRPCPAGDANRRDDPPARPGHVCGTVLRLGLHDRVPWRPAAMAWPGGASWLSPGSGARDSVRTGQCLPARQLPAVGRTGALHRSGIADAAQPDLVPVAERTAWGSASDESGRPRHREARASRRRC